MIGPVYLPKPGECVVVTEVPPLGSGDHRAPGWLDKPMFQDDKDYPPEEDYVSVPYPSTEAWRGVVLTCREMGYWIVARCRPATDEEEAMLRLTGYGRRVADE